MPRPEQPQKSEQELIAEERAAEMKVREVESRKLKAEAMGDHAALAQIEVDLLRERAKSLLVRADMQEGLEQHRKVKAWDAADRESREIHGKPLE